MSSARLKQQGVPDAEELQAVFPSDDRRKQGPVAVVECFQQIPCDPCQHACARGAIAEFNDINDLPIIDHDECNGCGLCISKCPGLAIFVIDETYSDTEGCIRVPSEFLPVPEAGQVVQGLDRQGQVVTEARIVKVQSGKALDKTNVVWMAVPKQYVDDVRCYRIERGEDQ